jgi:hypothetical protein
LVEQKYEFFPDNCKPPQPPQVFCCPGLPGISIHFTFPAAGQRGLVGADQRNGQKPGGEFASWIIENRMAHATENSEELWLCSKISVKVVGND